MTTFLASVFKILFATQEGLRERIGVSPSELAEATAEQAFKVRRALVCSAAAAVLVCCEGCHRGGCFSIAQDADENGDGKLTYVEASATWLQWHGGRGVTRCVVGGVTDTMSSRHGTLRPGLAHLMAWVARPRRWF
jgi:hypothetical protein